MVKLQKHKLYSVFFQDSKKSHILARAIQFFQKQSTEKIGDYNPNHVGCAFVDYMSVNSLAEAVFRSGNQIVNLDDKIKNHKGVVKIYDTSIRFSEFVLNTVIRQKINMPYRSLLAIQSIEFEYKKGIKNIPLNLAFWIMNSVVDFIKVFLPKNIIGSFCVKFLLEIIQGCDGEKKSKLSNVVNNRYEDLSGAVDNSKLSPIEFLRSTIKAKNKLIYVIQDGNIIFSRDVGTK